MTDRGQEKTENFNRKKKIEKFKKQFMGER